MISRLVRFLKCIRGVEVLIFQVPPLLGILFAEPGVYPSWPTLLWFFAGNLCLFVLIFAFNDWGDLELDSRDVNKRDATFVRKGVSRRFMLLMSAVLAVLVVVIFARFGLVTFLLAMVMLALGFTYSHPRFAQKRIPVVASLNHLVGGVTMFLLGYSVVGAVDPRGIAISLYFAVVFVAGHLCQEVRDHDQDKRHGVTTSAVHFGKRRTFLVAFCLFLLSFAYLFGLIRWGWFPGEWVYTAALLPIMAAGFVGAWKTPLGFREVSRFQMQYRLVFTVVGGFMLFSLLFTRVTP